jgi:hypothetical protein
VPTKKFNSYVSYILPEHTELVEVSENVVDTGLDVWCLMLLAFDLPLRPEYWLKRECDLFIDGGRLVSSYR